MRLHPFAALLLPVFLTGCALTPTATSIPSAGLVIHGKAIGGQQPIAGAHIYLMAANTTGYGNASNSLLSAAATLHTDAVGAYVLTDTFGGFDITSDYTCTANTEVYLYALGGNPGAGVNSGAGLMALLGNCPNSGSFADATPFIYMNEVSTVAAAYSMAGFATDATHVSSSGTALAQVGIANAFLTASNMVTLGTGQALTTTPAGNGTVPQSTINSLANILAACVNSTGPTSTPCSGLFTNTISGGVTPTDTASAAINIAHHPGSNVSNLFLLTPSSPPFAPTLASKPNDFLLALGFSGGGLSQPNYVAIDAVGNAWATNLNANTLSALSSMGIPIAGSPFTGNGLSGPGNHAIDDAGNVWVPNSNGTVSKFTSSGAPAGGSPYAGGASPISIAIDPSGNAWVANDTATGTVTKLLPSGVAAPGSPFAAGKSPATVAVDSLGGVWLANYPAAGGGTTITKLTNAGSPAPGSPFSGVTDEEFVAIDASNNAWVSSNRGANTVSKLSNTGAAFAGSPYSGGGMNNPYNTAFDGAGNLWIANAASLSELSATGAALSPSSAYAQGVLNNTSGIAVDGSGNLWISDYGVNKLVEVVGSAVPIVTPMGTAVKNGTLATRP